MTQIKDISTTKTTFTGTEYLVGQNAAGGAGSSWRGTVDALLNYTAKRYGWVNLLDYNADPTGVADSASAITNAHAAAAALSPKALVIAPIGQYKVASTATLLASMWGLGGQGYSSNFGRAVFVPTITNGTPALKAVNKNGLYFANFAVDTGQATNAALNCIGLQLGQCAALIYSITKTNSTTLTIVTEYLHTFQAGDAITFASVTGMVELTGNYTVLAATHSTKTFTITTANNATWGTFTPGTHVGLIHPTDLGEANLVARGVQDNLYVSGCATGFHLQGWLNKQLGLFATNCTLALDGSYLNSNTLDLTTENCGQAVQLLGCNKLNILKLEDEGDNPAGTNGQLLKPSTIDYSDTINVGMWSTEGTRGADTAWLTVGGVNLCLDIHIPHGIFSATPGSAKSVVLGNVTRWTLPRRMTNGYSTTASTDSRTSYSVTWASSGTQPAIGDGTLSGTYHWSGSEVTATIVLIKGSTTSLGTGTYTFSLPFTAKHKTVGSAYVFVSGTAHYSGTAIVSAGGSTVTVYVNNDTFGAAAPALATNGDNLLVSITYSL